MGATQLLQATYIQADITNISSARGLAFAAPFLTSWFCMAWTTLFFPLHLVSSTITSWWKKTNNSSYLLQEALHKFHGEGVSLGTLLKMQ